MPVSYDLLIVTFSILMAVLAVFVALDLSGRVAVTGGSTRAAWLIGGTLAMAVGMWAMHFTGMLALQLPVVVAYDVRGVVAALLIAVGASFVALLIAGSRAPRHWLVWIAALLMGFGMGAMHVVAMGAMRMAAMPSFIGSYITVSMIIAVLASLGILYAGARLRYDVSWRAWRSRVTASLLFGGGIALMHYTAMWGTRFARAAAPPLDPRMHLLATRGLAFTAIGSAMLIVFVAIAGAALDRWMRARLAATAEHARLRTEAEEARDVAEHARRQVQDVLDSITDAFFALDREWRFTYVNREAERVLFRTREELLGNSIWEEFPEALNSAFEHEYKRAVTDGVTVSFEEYYPPLDVWFEVRAYPSRDGLSVYFRNVNDRKRAEAERERLIAERDAEHQRLLTVLEQSPLAIVIAEAPSGRFLFANAKVAAIFGGMRLSEGVERYSDDFRGYHVDGRPIAAHEWPLARAIERGETVSNEIVRIVRGDQTSEITINAGPVRDGRGEIVAGVVIFWDVTEQRRAEEALKRARADAEEARRRAEEANRAKSEFLAAMSHELRTPLNAIAGYTELLELGVRGPINPAQHEDLERIKRSQQHLLALINDVLNFAKLEAGKVQLRSEVVDVETLLANVEPMILPQLRARGLIYERAQADPDLRARCDPDKTEQILLNLLSNAVKFTPTGGTVRVESCDGGSVTPNSVRIVVTDTGVGIPPDKLDVIFEPFVQVGRELTRTTEGAGLGLAISRDLALAMGGSLTAESELGEGSTFTLTLPEG